MGFNYAKEKKQFDREWEKLRKEYADAGMAPSAIESMRAYDWEYFLSRRTYESHTQPLPEATLRNDEEGQQNIPAVLLRKFSALTTSFDVEDFCGRYAWVDTIGSVELAAKLALLTDKDLELLTLYIIEGHSQAEIAQIQRRDQSVISRKIKRLKKFLKR